ncbi:hypothetical protein RvY_04354 [Ramazzottius varieornatus]|uniref:Uncharacterized protein n=1 Tax=Ramazzottius varieornatus TaxID=947166 RepID=A0A1D1UUR3_RAMVA|nr:hypothetical protein RvY_04354 [Ramazzottius varieornatus]
MTGQALLTTEPPSPFILFLLGLSPSLIALCFAEPSRGCYDAVKMSRYVIGCLNKADGDGGKCTKIGIEGKNFSLQLLTLGFATLNEIGYVESPDTHVYHRNGSKIKDMAGS